MPTVDLVAARLLVEVLAATVLVFVFVMLVVEARTYRRRASVGLGLADRSAREEIEALLAEVMVNMPAERRNVLQAALSRLP